MFKNLDIFRISIKDFQAKLTPDPEGPVYTVSMCILIFEQILDISSRIGRDLDLYLARLATLDVNLKFKKIGTVEIETKSSLVYIHKTQTGQVRV